MIDVKVGPMRAIKVAMLNHYGSYDTIGDTFEKLFQWVETFNVPVQRTIGIYYDNPDFVKEKDLRSAACVEVPDHFQITDRGNLSLLILSSIPGGEYASARFVGPYDKLSAVWTEMTSIIEEQRGLTINGTAAAFEVYVNDAEDTPPNQLITELYMPLA